MLDRSYVLDHIERECPVKQSPHKKDTGRASYVTTAMVATRIVSNTVVYTSLQQAGHEATQLLVNLERAGQPVIRHVTWNVDVSSDMYYVGGRVHL